MDELARWLGEQFDEDVRFAQATTWDGSGNKLSWELIASATIDVGGDEFYVGDRTIANHMMAWEPARVLREIDAKRRIVALHCDARGGDPSCSSIVYPEVAEDCETLRVLALPYADRPGYREKWCL